MLFTSLYTLILLTLSSFSTDPHSIESSDTVVVFDTLQWTELTNQKGFFIDIKYATTDNFVKEAVYPCARCFLRKDVAQKLIQIKNDLAKEGYGLKMFDCYRPLPVQQKLWNKVPDPNYVARPSEGSMHNRGTAVDLTLTDLKGKELDMGTSYDFFGPEAHHDNTALSEKILNNRKKLKATMEKAGFRSIRTEWWHYSYAGTSYPLSDWEWACD